MRGLTAMSHRIHIRLRGFHGYVKSIDDKAESFQSYGSATHGSDEEKRARPSGFLRLVVDQASVDFAGYKLGQLSKPSFHRLAEHA